MYNTLFGLLLTCLSLGNCFAQNNSIFNGGQGDGFSSSAYLQSAVDINNSIFNGGAADGFVIATFIQSLNTLNNPIFNGGVSDGFAIATLGGVGSEVPLPVELTFFNAAHNNGLVNLHWQTASEVNNDYFEVERMMGHGFEPIGRIQGSGISTTSKNYSFTDSVKIITTTYYRLRQVDFHGDSKYSNIIKVDIEPSHSQIVLYPNPTTTGSFYFSIQNDFQNDLLVSIIDATGLLIKEKIVLMHEPFGEWHVSESLENGFYIITVKSGLNHYTQRLLVIR